MLEKIFESPEQNYQDYSFPACFREGGICPCERAGAEVKKVVTRDGDRYVIDLTLERGGVVYRRRLWPRNRPGTQAIVEGPIGSFYFRIGHYHVVDPITGEEKILTGVKHLLGDGEMYGFSSGE